MGRSIRYQGPSSKERCWEIHPKLERNISWSLHLEINQQVLSKDMSRNTVLIHLLFLQLLTLLGLNISAKGSCFMKSAHTHYQNYLRAMWVLTVLIALSACTVCDLQRNLGFELFYRFFMGFFVCFIQWQKNKQTCSSCLQMAAGFYIVNVPRGTW